VPDQPTRVTIRDALLGAANLEGATAAPLLAEEADNLAEAVMDALTTTGAGLSGSAWFGPFLTPEELTEIKSHDLWTEAEQAALVRHIAALDATIANQVATMAAQRRRVRELGRLQTELPRALYLTPLDEVMGRNVMAADVKLVAEVLRAAQAEREGRRG